MPASKDWWAPVWKGLVIDGSGKHCHKIRTSLWLLLYFILCSDRKTGTTIRKVSTIGRQMGVKVRTVRQWLTVLRQSRYISTRNSGRFLLVTINKWKTLPDSRSYARQNDKTSHNSITNSCQSGKRVNAKWPDLSHAFKFEAVPNDITLTKDIIKNVGDELFSKTNFKSDDHEGRYRVALYLSTALNDTRNFPSYLSYVRKYPLLVIQKAFKAATKIPANKIKKTRGALFTYLVKFYANKEASTNPGN